MEITNRKYSLNSKFTPQTEETSVALDIANFFQDTNNYAFYRSVVKKIGISKSLQLFHEIKETINYFKNTKKKILSPKKYFAGAYKKVLEKFSKKYD